MRARVGILVTIPLFVVSPGAAYHETLYFIDLPGFLVGVSRIKHVDTRSSTEVGAGSVAHIDLAGTEASMTVRELLRELSLHPPDAIVITRYDEAGFTDDITVSTLLAKALNPPLLGVSFRVAGGGDTGEQIVSAVLIGPPETF